MQHRDGRLEAAEWILTLGAAGFLVVTALTRRLPNATAFQVAPSGWHLLAGLAAILVALLVRWSRTGRLFPRTAFDWPLLLFSVSACLGWLCAYSPELGQLKLLLILNAVAIFYTLAGAAPSIAGCFAQAFVLAAAALAIVFVTQHDFVADPVLAPLLGQIGQWFYRIVPGPKFGHYLPNANVIAAVLAMAVWFNLAWLAGRRQQAAGNLGMRRVLTSGLFSITLVCLAVGLLLTNSQGAWAALAVTLGVQQVLRVAARLGGRIERDSSRVRGYLVGLAIVLALSVPALYLVLLVHPDWAQAFPGLGILAGRAALQRDAFFLGYDYLWTGLGLGAFQMVYSSYSLLLHVGFLPHAHNLFLQVWLEQGLLGVIGLVWLIIAAGRYVVGRYLAHSESTWYSSAASWSIMALSLHGLVDAPLYVYRSTLMLLIPFGLLLAGRPRGGAAARQRERVSPLRFAGVALVLGLLATGIVWRRPIAATALANLGALDQTRNELRLYSWPSWPIQDEARRQTDLQRAADSFQDALALDPWNVTANRRLGMIALSLGEYKPALAFLQAAYAVTPADSATRQLLGEAYVVNGRIDEGVALWSSMNRAQSQLEIRAWWYGHIGDVERSEWVKQAVQLAAQ